MQNVLSWIEANEGLASFALSVVAILAAVGVAILEWRRAVEAETERLRGPATAAISLLDRTILQLRTVIDAQTEADAEAKLVFANRWAERAAMAAKGIASIPVPNADLIVSLHETARALENVSIGIEKVPEGNAFARRQVCQGRIIELEVWRKELVVFTSKKKSKAV